MAFDLNATADMLIAPSIRDNTLYEDATGSLSNGSGAHFFAGNNGGGMSRRGLVRFDLSALPADATITSVTLTLHMSLTSSGVTSISLHRVLSDWGEGASDAPGNEGGGAPAAIADATWLHTFYNTSLWINPGGDFTPAASAATAVDAVGFYQWSSELMMADVQAWRASPAANFGWLLLGDETMASTSKRFDSRENAVEAFRPTLTVHYVPGPGGLALLAGWGGINCRRRRRR